MNALLKQIVVRCCVLASLLTGAAAAQPLAIPGSGSPEVLLRELARTYNLKSGGELATVPPSTGTAGGLRSVESGEARLGRIARTLKPDEAARGLLTYPIARDAVVFAVGVDVAVRSLTRQQLHDAFSGKLDRWDAAGGHNRPIRLITREESDTSLAVIRAAFPAFRTLAFSSSAKQVNRDPDMLKMLEQYGSSLGFLTQASLRAAGRPVHALAIDGIAPTPANVADGRYPLSVPYLLVSKGLATGEAARFVDFVYSPEGRTVIERLGLLPVARS